MEHRRRPCRHDFCYVRIHYFLRFSLPLHLPVFEYDGLLTIIIRALASSMLTPGVGQIMDDFNTDSKLLQSFVVSVYILGYASGPLIIAPLSELYGRSILYHITNILCVVFTIACAVSPSLGSLIGFRLLAGMAGSAVLNIGGGTIADLFIQEERGSAMAIWTVGPLLGPVIGPVAGGFLSEAKGWRSVFWVLSGLVGSLPRYLAGCSH